MKIKIIQKNIKEGVTASGSAYCIKSLYCSVDNKEDANTLAKSAMDAGADKEMVAKLIKANDYNGSISYAFGLNCSNFTFDKVDRFGILDAKVVFAKNEKGFVNAKIQVIDKKEQVFGYESPVEDVQGWASPAPANVPSSQGNATTVTQPYQGASYPNIAAGEPTDDLPF